MWIGPVLQLSEMARYVGLPCLPVALTACCGRLIWFFGHDYACAHPARPFSPRTEKLPVQGRPDVTDGSEVP